VQPSINFFISKKNHKGGKYCTLATMGQDIPVSEQLHVESVSTVTGEIDDDAHISPIMKITSGLVYWSPSGLHVAVAKDNRLTLRDATTLQIVQQFSTLDMIQAIGWSPDSHLVLTAMYKRGIVQVWSVKDGAWTCKITEGIAGMVRNKCYDGKQRLKSGN
jgi:WD40 repeat protein